MEKDKAKPIRCLLDATKLPPSAFALSDDGRKRASKCAQRKALFCALAAFANPDGSSSYPSKTTLHEMTGLSQRTIGRTLVDLRRLGVLVAGDLHAFYKTRVWSLHFPKETEPDSGERPSLIRTETGPDSHAPMPDSRVSVTGSPESGSHTALSLPPIQTPTHRGASDLSSYKQIAKWLPEEMAGAQKRRGELAQIEKLISEHGGAKFLAAVKHYVERPSADADAKLSCKWTAFIENSEYWFGKPPSPPLERQAFERWMKENPEEYQRLQDEAIARDDRERIAKEQQRAKAVAASTNECDVDDFFGKDTND
jgi:hypothetical protein